MTKAAKDPKVLSPWAPFAWHTRLREWLDEHRRTERLEWSAERGLFVHTVKSSPGVWAEAGTYASQRDFALSIGLIGARDA